MARTRSSASLPSTGGNSFVADPLGHMNLTASAATLPVGSPAEISWNEPVFGEGMVGQAWQHEAYRFYRQISEAHYAVQILARSMGLATLSGSTDAAQAALDALFSGPMAQQDFLEQAGTHLSLGGEFYLIGRKPRPAEKIAFPSLSASPNTRPTMPSSPATDGEVLWEVVGVPEISNEGNVIRINHGGSSVPIVLGSGDAAIRFWESDPAAAYMADSPMRPLLSVLSEIEAADNRVMAMLTSRLTGNGVLAVPESWEMPPAPGEAANPASRATSFMRTLAAVAAQAIQNPSSPAAKIPIVVTKPDGSTEQMEWQTFWSELDAETVSNRQDAIRRFATGFDLPPEQILGMGGQAQGQHTGAGRFVIWAVEESTIKIHIEPMLRKVASMLERHFVRPITGDPDARIKIDTTGLRLPPDRSKESLELYDRGIVGDDTVRQSNGFQPEDKPTDDEIKNSILRRMALGSASPEQVAAAAAQLGVEVPTPHGDTPSATPAPQNQATQVAEEKARAMLDAPAARQTSHPMAASAAVAHEDPGQALSAEFVISCEATVLRTLERVGSRLIRENSKSSPVNGVSATEAHVTFAPTKSTNLDSMFGGPDVFGLTLLSPVSDKPRELLGYLNEFAESLVHARKAYSRDSLVKALGEGEFRG